MTDSYMIDAMVQWRDVRLGDIGQIVTGKTPPCNDRGNFGSDIPFITPGDMCGKRYISATRRMLSVRGQKMVAGALIPAQTVIVSCIGSALGKVAMTSQPSVTNQQINSIIVRPPHVPLYVYYSLSQRQAELRRYAGGSAQPIVNKSVFSRLPFRLAPLAHQQAVARIIGSLDDKIELNHRMHCTLEQLATVLFYGCFVSNTPVLCPACPSEFVALNPGTVYFNQSHLDGIIREQNRSLCKAAVQGCKMRALEDVAKVVGGKQISDVRLLPYGDIPVFGGGGVMGYAEQYNVQGFVIAVSRVGSNCGQFFSHRGKAWISNNASSIQPFNQQLAPWLYYALKRTNTQMLRKGAAQPYITNYDLRRLPIIWPDQRLIERYTSMIAPLVKTQDQLMYEIAHLMNIKNVLLSKLLSDKLLDMST